MCMCVDMVLTRGRDFNLVFGLRTGPTYRRVRVLHKISDCSMHIYFFPLLENLLNAASCENEQSLPCQ